MKFSGVLANMTINGEKLNDNEIANVCGGDIIIVLEKCKAQPIE
ncbi:MAG: hypothetical protein ACTS73_09085 [Arsenophonus sp. NEOnobi-MAG3]